MNLRSPALISLTVLLLLGCSVSNFELPQSSMKFVPGSYEAVISGSRMATLDIDDQLNYIYVEDSTRNGLIRQVQRRGTLRFSSWRTAKAGLVKLEWVSGNSIKVESPFSSTIGNGNNEGNVAYSSGPYITGMPLHVFYLNKKFDEVED